MRKNNSDFLKSCMADAVYELLKNKPIEKISVTEITEKAGVGRATWFRNFSSKQDAISYKIISLWYKWCDEHKIAKEQRYTLDNALDFFNFSLDNKEIYITLYKSNLQSTIYNAFYNVIVQQQRNTPYEYYRSRFLSYGVYGVVDEWVKRGFKESPNELASILNQTVIPN